MVISMFLPITLFPKEKRLEESHLQVPFLLLFFFLRRLKGWMLVMLDFSGDGHWPSDEFYVLIGV